MATLADLADELRLPLQSEDRPGLRAAQVAAVHAVAGHFWASSRPALVVMPTGSGKTAVMMATSILLRANRVLVVSPSRLLREQLSDSFRALRDLRETGAIGSAARSPKVHEVKGKLTTRAKWAALRKVDVVVGTPAACSPGSPGVFVPPTDLFDVVLFDEAHHVPAKTYSAIGQAFPAARQVLFTATPFRRDEREIRADLVFTYELAQARRDGIFGKLHYRAVEPNEKQSEDVAIAVASAAQLRSDRKRGFDHRLVVRASSRDRADQLEKLYATHTRLSLRRLHSGLSSRSIKQAVEELRAGKIDGVIAVDMLGEGFDLPQLKVAALHAPHRSLAVTLQFIGRFARTTAPNLGPATFFTVARDVEAEARRLFVPGAEWNEIVEDLSRQRLAVEQETRTTIASFETVEEVAADVDSRERQRAILWGLRPYFHVKIYETTSPVDLDAELTVPSDLEPVLIQRSREENTLIWIGRSTKPLRWSSSEALADVTHDMFLVVNVPEHRLLFVCTSRRLNSVYDDVVASLTVEARRLAANEITRVLRGIDNQELFSVGMRNRAGVGGGGAESYRILTGRSAGKAIRAGDVGLYDQGHVFCRGTESGEDITIGYSSASKVWTNRYESIPALLGWIRALAQKVSDTRAIAVQSLFDQLGKATRIEALPCEIIAADLPPAAYDRPATMIQTTSGHVWLVDCSVDVEEQTATTAVVVFRAADHALRSHYDIGRRPHFVAADTVSESAKLVDAAGRHDESLGAFLNESPPAFFLTDLSLVVGDTLSAPPSGSEMVVRAQIEAIEWNAFGVDPCLEKPPSRGKKRGKALKSLFEYIEQRARADNVNVLFADDAANEIADYVVVRREPQRTLVQLIHCKASSTKRVPGERVQDLYEVLGQAVKCRRWLDRRRLLKQVKHRLANTGSHFVLGDLPTLTGLLEDATRLVFEVVVVQPGLSTEPKDTVADLLLAVDAYQRGADRLPLRLWGTKPQ